MCVYIYIYISYIYIYIYIYTTRQTHASGGSKCFLGFDSKAFCTSLCFESRIYTYHTNNIYDIIYYNLVYYICICMCVYIYIYMYTHNIVIANHISRAVMRFANACSFAAAGLRNVRVDNCKRLKQSNTLSRNRKHCTYNIYIYI